MLVLGTYRRRNHVKQKEAKDKRNVKRGIFEASRCRRTSYSTTSGQIGDYAFILK